MAASATFIFHSSLADFLPKRRAQPINYTFSGTPSVKEAIEYIGVPHVEVDVILVNNQSVDFTYLLSPADHILVYPKGLKVKENTRVIHLIKKYPAVPAFILDVHLGKLARLLRMLGFDALYEQNFADAQIATIAANESRIVLTRDIPLLKRKIIEWGYWLRSQQPQQQLLEVIRYFDLAGRLKPFYRCMACNRVLIQVEKKDISNRLQPQTTLFFEEFYQCNQCHRVYWKGSHYEKMEKFIQGLINNQIISHSS